MRYRASLLILIIAVPAFAERHSVTVLLDFDQPHSDVAVKAMRTEAQHLLRGSGIDLDIKLRSEVPPDAEFSDVLVFKMTGRCGTAPDPMLIDERGPLAEAYETDGQILSFGAIHCDQVRAVLAQSPKAAVWRRSASRFGASLLGSALGRVLAHETYHMLGETFTHTKKGVTRATLSPADLSELGPFFDDAARDRIQQKKSQE